MKKEVENSYQHFMVYSRKNSNKTMNKLLEKKKKNSI